MQRYEYHVVPAPRRGEQARGAKTGEERFAAALSEVMNALGAEGWDYVRSDVLPCEERQGLTGKTTVYHSVLVFRRGLPAPEGKAETGPAMAAPPAAGSAAAVAPATGVASAPLPSPAALPAFLAPAPRVAAPPLNPAPPIGPAERPSTD